MVKVGDKNVYRLQKLNIKVKKKIAPLLYSKKKKKKKKKISMVQVNKKKLKNRLY